MPRKKNPLKVKKAKRTERRKRRRFTEEFKAEAVRMLLDGHTALSISERLGLSGPNVLYRWKREAVRQGGTAATGLEGRVRELEADLRRVERECDILKKCSAFSAATGERRVRGDRSGGADGRLRGVGGVRRAGGEPFGILRLAFRGRVSERRG